ncbi:hypothetical protein PFISCL1PPCAC_6740, partial [Pristionchus fissidentatus]
QSEPSTVQYEPPLSTLLCDAIPSALPQINPQPGVDPFAILRRCDKSERSLGGDVDARLKILHGLFIRCCHESLVQRTSHLIGRLNLAKKCSLCSVWLESASSLIAHICDSMHRGRTRRSVSADAFDFWRDAVLMSSPHISMTKERRLQMIALSVLRREDIAVPPFEGRSEEHSTTRRGMQ